MHNCLLEGEKEGSGKVGRTRKATRRLNREKEREERRKVHHVASERKRERLR